MIETLLHACLSLRQLVRAAALLVSAALMAGPVVAEDIDLFTAGAGGAAAMPNVMILVDNSSNWARESQKWPDSDGKQGAAELGAIEDLLKEPIAARVGLAAFTGSGNTVGGYIRFAARDMGVQANRTALRSILAHMRGNLNSADEKVNDNEEAAGMFEVYRYFTGGAVFRGARASNNPSANVDTNLNAGSPASGSPTAYAQGLRSGFAISGSSYQRPGSGGCGRNYLVMVINNSQGRIPEGSQSYDGVSAGAALTGGSASSWTEEWARFLYQQGITVYVLDAYNAQQNTSHSQVLARAARVGGGRYYAVKNRAQVQLALDEIMAEVNAVDSSFSSASLPISAASRSRHLNQLYLGMFRPDASARPRWAGNLKRYQIGSVSNELQLVDVLGNAAASGESGFIAHCAVSAWTTGSGTFWEDVLDNASLASQCGAFPSLGGVAGGRWSDLPDGPSVAKGGAAEVLRKGNNPPASNTTPTWDVGSRKILTYSASEASKLAVFSRPTDWTDALFSWFRGLDDTTSETVDGVTSRPFTEFSTTRETARTRPSIHGDVIHSRPLPVDHGSAKGVTVYYGSNDGLLRALDGATGRERWAFIAPEHYARIARLRNNAPRVSLPGVDADLSPQPKDYFFDGSLGLYQKADNSQVWIFPSMRRGGRMLYGFDVSDPDNPRLKWRIGCPNLSNDTGCTAGFSGIGQTWSTPVVAFLKGWNHDVPVLIVGGGYDGCEDVDRAATVCSSQRKGAKVYVINADTGELLHTFSTGGSVAADIALADVNNDGSVDYGYAVTTTGEIWRMDFSDASHQPAGASAWGIRKVAYSPAAGRKFLQAPALLATAGRVYVAVGSGNRERPLAANYPYKDSVTSRFYVFLDTLATRASSTEAAVDLDADAQVEDYSGTEGATCETQGVTPSSGKKGWRMDLPGRGEQTVSSALIVAGAVTFNTHQPTAASEQSCGTRLGSARGYWLNLLNGAGTIGSAGRLCGGSRSASFVGGGLAPSPSMASVLLADGRTVDVVLGAVDRDGGASTNPNVDQLRLVIPSRRRILYWKSGSAD